MAHVYQARDTLLERNVVIKVPRRAVLEEAGFSARFTREVRALSQLAHPNVVKVIDVGQYEDIPFAVLQLLTGGSLRDRLRPGGRRTRLLPDTLPQWLRGTASALDFIHARGFVHRDVKPDNILFDGQGHPYLSDFGIAKALADGRPADQQTILTSTGVTLGTPQYMAPELLLGKPYDGRADQYALAVTVYEALAGMYPYDGPTPAAIVLKQTSESPTPLNAAVPSAPPHVVAAVGRALSADPAQRFPSCGAFAQAVLTVPAVLPMPVPGPAPLPVAEVLPLPEHRRADAAPLHRPHAPAGPEVEVKAVVACTHCGREVVVRPDAIGKKVRCPRCRKVFPTTLAVPEAGPALPASATPAHVQARIPTPVTVQPLDDAPPLIEHGPPPVGSLGWVLPRLCAGLVLGGGAGYVFELYRKALAARSSVEREDFLVLVLIAWAVAGVLAAFLGWLQEPPASRARAPQRLFFWLFGGVLGGAAFGWSGASAGFWAGGPMGVVYGMGALGAGLGLMFGWVSGGDFGRALAGAFVGATLGEVMAATALLLRHSQGDLPYLTALGAGFGVVWAIVLCRMLPLPLPGLLTSTLAVAAAGGLLLRFTLADTGLVCRFEGHTRAVRALAFSHDGSKILSGSEDQSVRVWDVETGTELKRLRGFQHPVLQVAGLQGQEVLAGCSGGTLRRWHLNDDNHPPAPQSFTGPAACLSFSADGRWALWGGADGGLYLHNLQETKPPVLVGHHGASVYALALSPDAHHAASAGAGGTVFAWDLLTKQKRPLKGHEGDVRAVALSSGGRSVLTGGEDGSVRVWNFESGEESQRLQGHRGAVTCVAFTRDDLRVLSGGRDKTVRLWHVSTETELRRYEGQTEPASAVAFSPDGDRALSASEDGTLWLWRLPR